MRTVRDKIVQDRMRSIDSPDTLYVQELARYDGIVDTNLERVGFESAALGLPLVQVTDGLQSKYDILRINDNECYVKFDDATIRTTSTVIRLLKVLAMEQVTPNVSYSYIVATVFMQLLKAVVTQSTPMWKRPEGYTDYDYVYWQIVDWVRKELSKNE